MPGPFSLDLHRRGRNATVVVRGELDRLTTPQLCEAVEEAIDAGALDVLVDCRAMGFLDSAGVGALLDLKKQLAERGGVLILFGPAGPVEQTLAVTGLDSVFHIVEAPPS